METLPTTDHLRRKIILHRKCFGEYTIKVKPLCLTRDIRHIHRWVNMEYTKAFWQMEWSYSKIYRHYEGFIMGGQGYSLMFFVDQKRVPVALMDCYLTCADEVCTLYDACEEDFGIHMLMAPKKYTLPRLSTNVMITGISFLFSLGIERILGEPDVRNEAANALVKRVGFRFLGEIQMSYKKANLYVIEKDNFFEPDVDTC